MEQVQSEIFDVIISDIKLTGMDGLEFLARIKKIDDDLPVILVTGYANLETAKEAVALNAYSYLIKPLENFADLLTPLKNAVAGYKLKQENKILREHYENIVGSVPDGILTINTSLIVESVNKAFLGMFKLKDENVLNKHIKNVFDDKVISYINQLMESLGLEDNSIRFEWTSLDENTEDRFWASLTLRRALIGKKDSILMVVSDITDMKKAPQIIGEVIDDRL